MCLSLEKPFSISITVCQCLQMFMFRIIQYQIILDLVDKIMRVTALIVVIKEHSETQVILIVIIVTSCVFLSSRGVQLNCTRIKNSRLLVVLSPFMPL